MQTFKYSVTETPEENPTIDLVNALHLEPGIERPTAIDTPPRLFPAPAPTLASVVNQVNQASASAEVLAQSSEPIIELEPDVLSIRGRASDRSKVRPQHSKRLSF